jgi:hypothetical protein
VHSPWTAWDKSVAIAELQEMTDWNATEISRQLGVSASSVNTLIALQLLSTRTISTAQKAKLPTEAVGRIGHIIKHVEPEKAKAIEDAFIGGVETGKIYDRRTSNKFVIACKRASVDQLKRYGSVKKYTADDLLKDNLAEHAATEATFLTSLCSNRSMAKKLVRLFEENDKLIMKRRTMDLTSSVIVSLTRLMKAVGDRVEKSDE